MKKKNYSHSVSMRSGASRKDGNSGKMKMRKAGVDKKSMEDIYNKFYRDQVAALYRAVRGF